MSRSVACCALALLLPAFAAVRARAQASTSDRPAAKPAEGAFVLVELFTSEGCPHCPEADALLHRLYAGRSIDGAQIVALEEHVDYWDTAKWVDHFSSSAFTQRQKLYADAMDLDSLYTPQMIVDGLVEFVGNNEGRARATISALGHTPIAAVRILPPEAVPGPSATPPIARVRLEANGLTLNSSAAVYLVLAEDQLFSRVSGGSNAGESWPHSSIARWLHATGTLAAKDATFNATVAIAPLQPEWHAENLRLIALVQEEETRRVVALGTARLTDILPALKGAPQPAGVVPTPPPTAPKSAPASSKPY
jgi:hypothetical protein